MTKRKSGIIAKRAVAGSVVSQQDADAYRDAVKAYAKEATTSKEAARKKLQSLGIYTATGRLTARYG